ncbi:glycerophosphodiester phosphodiesterase [Actinoplanes sp. M2I2]|uniref:glycerophosphodiester phosphodiesterase n=1 Tax=Actinoplanes sp. M2I2 TaxID=1734444 RepID=UPI0020226207|nr:glycerophosphodiester phosphodiesterase [Actinoplanes sp. M2I2]
MRFLDAPTPLAFAHRGGAADGDENTVESFERAVKLGYRYVETDVHATADGVAVVFHDKTLDRVTGQAGRISSLTWADLQSVRIAGAALVPRLDEVLAAWPEVRFNIDIKADPGVEPTVETILRSDAAGRVLLASFDDRRLTRARALAGPTVATSLGSRSVARLRLASLAGLPLRLPPSVAAVQVPPRLGRFPVVDKRFLALSHRLGLQVHVWTIDDPAEMNRLLDLGVDGIMTDRLTVLRDVYLTRGLWH